MGLQVREMGVDTAWLSQTRGMAGLEIDNPQHSPSSPQHPPVYPRGDKRIWDEATNNSISIY